MMCLTDCMELDLFVDEDNDVCCFENHFYDNTRKPYKLPKESLADGLRSIVEAFDSYKLLKEYSKSINSIFCRQMA